MLTAAGIQAQFEASIRRRAQGGQQHPHVARMAHNGVGAGMDDCVAPVCLNADDRREESIGPHRCEHNAHAGQTEEVANETVQSAAGTP